MVVNEKGFNINSLNNMILKNAAFETREDAIRIAKQQHDSFEYVGIETFEGCEQYNVLGSKLVKAGTVRLGVSNDIKRDMLGFLEEYYEGMHTDEELKLQYIDYCEQIGVSGKTRLLDVYENFINMSRYAANNVCIRKGYGLTEKYGKVEDHDAVYYNADYYYSFLEVKEITRNASEKIAEEMNWGELDFEERENSTIFNLDGEFSFNGKWAWVAQNQINRCTMINTEIAPPSGFEIYFKEKKYAESEEGIMLLATQGGYKEIDVPFVAPKAGIEEDIQKFNVAEIFTFSEEETPKYEEYNSYLKNFDIYTRLYFSKNERNIL